mmetsp:Transcript_1319/g.3886  ORF Transcript_1319/g.3886 Transcript_1319/m.3886 type:complete len:232 (+) Transcript_1319:784-1479(+)
MTRARPWHRHRGRSRRWRGCCRHCSRRRGDRRAPTRPASTRFALRPRPSALVLPAAVGTRLVACFVAREQDALHMRLAIASQRNGRLEVIHVLGWRSPGGVGPRAELVHDGALKSHSLRCSLVRQRQGAIPLSRPRAHRHQRCRRHSRCRSDVRRAHVPLQQRHRQVSWRPCAAGQRRRAHHATTGRARVRLRPPHGRREPVVLVPLAQRGVKRAEHRLRSRRAVHRANGA